VTKNICTMNPGRNATLRRLNRCTHFFHALNIIFKPMRIFLDASAISPYGIKIFVYSLLLVRNAVWNLGCVVYFVRDLGGFGNICLNAIKSSSPDAKLCEHDFQTVHLASVFQPLSMRDFLIPLGLH